MAPPSDSSYNCQGFSVLRYCFGLIVILVVAFLAYLGIGALTDGYFSTNIIPDNAVPDSWAAPDSWSEWRDIVLVICGLFFAVAILVLILILVALLRLVITVRKLASDRIGPTMDTIQDLIVSVRATTDFVGEAVVSPIIRIYGIVSALKTLMFGANHLFEDERSNRAIPFEWKQLLRLLSRIFGSEKNDQ